MNQSILDILPGTEYVKFGMYQAITQEYPQINAQTRVKPTTYLTVHVAALSKNIESRIWQERSGIKARLWRILGELLNRMDIKAKGMESVSSLIVTHEIVLGSLGWAYDGDIYHIYLGYSPLEDILYYKE